MKLQILGIRCAKCHALTQATTRAGQSLGPQCELETAIAHHEIHHLTLMQLRRLG